MVISRSQSKSKTDLSVLHNSLKRFEACRICALAVCVLLLMSAVYAQGSGVAAGEKVVVVDGVTDSTVYGVGQSIQITGTVKQGAISFGGDVIVDGVVEGDVATIGGSVIQSDGARIGGDVIVLGGTYRHGDKSTRNPSAMTMIFAGYQQELRDMMRDPTGLLRPRWSPSYLGMRLLAVLFWFIVSLALTAAMPGAISRGVARLQLTSLRVAFIGLIGVVVVSVGLVVSAWIMPQTISVLIGLMAFLLGLVAGLFGRVILYAATGRWLQRKYIPVGKNSETVALLLGTSFWVVLTSLPYVWPFVVSFIIVISLGLALTARYRVGWRRPQTSPTF